MISCSRMGSAATCKARPYRSRESVSRKLKFELLGDLVQQCQAGLGDTAAAAIAGSFVEVPLGTVS